MNIAEAIAPNSRFAAITLRVIVYRVPRQPDFCSKLAVEPASLSRAQLIC
jgi:hypothetical protein